MSDLEGVRPMGSSAVAVVLAIGFIACAGVLVVQGRRVERLGARVRQLEQEFSLTRGTTSGPAPDTEPEPGPSEPERLQVRQPEVPAAPTGRGEAEPRPTPQPQGRPDQPATAPIDQVIDSWAENELRRFTYRTGHRDGRTPDAER